MYLCKQDIPNDIQDMTGTDFTKNLKIDFDSCVYVDKERYEQDEFIKLKVGDVLITKDGTLGKVAYIDKLDTPATLNGGVFVVRDLENRVIPQFITYYLSSYHFKKMDAAESYNRFHPTLNSEATFQLYNPSIH